MKMYKDGGQITIAGLTTKEAACLQHGLFLLDGHTMCGEKGEYVDFDGCELEPFWPQELNRLLVTNGEVQVFTDSFCDQYDKNVYKIKRLEELNLTKGEAYEAYLAKQDQAQPVV